MTKRWHVGQPLGRVLYFDGKCVGMVDTPALAEAIVAAMNAVGPRGLTCCEIVGDRPCGEDASRYHPESHVVFCVDHGGQNPKLTYGLAPHDAKGHAVTCDRISGFPLPSYVIMPLKVCAHCGEKLSYTWPKAEPAHA